MNVTFRCPHCDASGQVEFDAATAELACPQCLASVSVPVGAVSGERVEHCLVCPSAELYVRKDFSQTVGVAIVAIGFVASSVAWYFRLPLLTYGILFATALIDVVLYVTVGNLLQCYRCHAQYRGVEGLDRHESFNLETHEKYRQQAIRLAQAQQAAGASDAGPNAL